MAGATSTVKDNCAPTRNGRGVLGCLGMNTPQTIDEILDYIENVQQRYEPLKSFGFGFNGEMGVEGSTEYPHLFVEAEMLANEVNPGMDGYNVALVFLSKPETPGTNAEREQSNASKQWGDEFIEILRMEQILGTVKVTDKLAVPSYGNEGTVGWRFEVSFESMKAIDRAAIRSRLTPLA